MTPMPVQRLGRRGTSYVELIVSTLLVSIVLLAALNTAGSAARTATATADQGLGQRFATELLAEMMAMPYHDPQSADADEHFGIEADEPPAPANRLAFDDVDDYAAWNENGGTLLDREGKEYPATAGWSRKAEVEKIASDLGSLRTLDTSEPDQGVRRLAVTVSSPAGEETRVEAIRSIRGAAQQPFATDATLVSGVLIELQVGGATVSAAAPVLNSARQE